MNQTRIQVLNFIFTVIGAIAGLISFIIAILSAMFPQLLPTVGTFLLSVNRYMWIVLLLLLIVAGQQTYIWVKLRRATPS